MTGYYWIALLAIAGIIASVGAIYISLLRRRLGCHIAWVTLRDLLHERLALVATLTDVVAMKAAHEEVILTEMLRASQEVRACDSITTQAFAEQELTLAIESITALGDIYPSLQTSDAFLKLVAKLTAVEDDIRSTCRQYNLLVSQFNRSLSKFPQRWAGKIMNFHHIEQFDQ